ncbi:hypothetical protein C7M56_10490 [Clostridium botulinum]|uniref:Uncharacterized protein n=1 Tax=Clostridium botulinum TaxID=1491 RepID=A0ABC8CVN7_CLOBO|nr:hypothetical protein [Clostridium botulinum]AVQ39093.1 hypothetical protein C7M56_10490 [Clostridium botulinum]
MLKIIIDFIKDKNKNITYCLFFIGLICFVSVKNWGFVEETYHMAYSIFIILMNHIISMIFIVTILVGINLILKHSDKKSMEDINNYYEKELVIKSSKNRNPAIELKENREKLNNKYGKSLEVIIKNTIDSTIDYIRGTVFLYDNEKKRIKSIVFEIKNLRKSYSVRIFYDLLDIKERNWSEFDGFIEEYKIGDEIQQNFFIEGRKVLRPHFIILNYSKFYDYKILGIRTKYNLVWLKNKIRHELVPAVRFFYSKKVWYRDRRAIYIELKDLVIRLLRFLLVVIVAILIVSLLVIILIDIQKMLISMFNICKNYFQHVAKLF